MNAGDTAFILISAALVMIMTPGLALFFGGMVRNKNVLGTIMQSFIILKIIDVLIGLRVSEEEEVKVLDISLHNEAGYSI